jgi:predicted phosphate transport protein (TIGR00153 family)
MFKWFLPKEYSFYDYFEQHAAISIKTCRVLLECATGEKDVNTAFTEVKQLEQEADNVTHFCINALQKTFITPIERTDIHRLMKRMDDIVDSIDSALTRISMYEITLMRPEMKELSEILVKSTLEIEKALKGLRKIKDQEYLHERCNMIHELENQGDIVHRSAVKKLFQEDNAVLILKWKEILDRLERANDRCEDVANIIESVIIGAS